MKISSIGYIYPRLEKSYPKYEVPYQIRDWGSGSQDHKTTKIKYPKWDNIFQIGQHIPNWGSHIPNQLYFHQVGFGYIFWLCNDSEIPHLQYVVLSANGDLILVIADGGLIVVV